MFTVKIMRSIPVMALPDADGTYQNPQLMTELIAAREVFIIKREPGMFTELVITKPNGERISRGVANRNRKPPEEPSIVECEAGYEAYIENAAGATTEVIRF